MTIPPYWFKASEYLASRDRILSSLIASYPHETMTHTLNPFATLVKAIIGQQISVKAASAISSRLESLIGTFSSQHYLAAGEEELRECGLSRQKIRYITNVAKAFEQGCLTPTQWVEMGDEQIEKQLTSISGIGKWTAQMFLIFHLHRPDILPLNDIGLLKSVAKHYASGKQLSKTEVLEIASVWKPYRTVATWYLWRSLDPLPVQY